MRPKIGEIFAGVSWRPLLWIPLLVLLEGHLRSLVSKVMFFEWGLVASFFFPILCPSEETLPALCSHLLCPAVLLRHSCHMPKVQPAESALSPFPCKGFLATDPQDLTLASASPSQPQGSTWHRFSPFFLRAWKKNPNLLFLAFLDFLAFSFSRNSLRFWAFFPSFPRILGVRQA